MKRPAARAPFAADPRPPRIRHSKRAASVVRKRPAASRTAGAVIGALQILVEEFPGLGRREVARFLNEASGNLRVAFQAAFRWSLRRALTSRSTSPDEQQSFVLTRTLLARNAANHKGNVPLAKASVPIAAAASVAIEWRAGRGYTLVAQRDFESGAVLFRERPLVLWERGSDDDSDGFPHCGLSDMFWMAPTCVQTAILDLFAGDAGEPVQAGPDQELVEMTRRLNRIAWYNGIPLECNGHARETPSPTCRLGGMFRLLCRASHSCQPVADFRAAQGDAGRHGEQVVVSLSAIHAGDEVTISYLRGGQLAWPTEQRQHFLQRRFDFLCDCRRCLDVTSQRSCVSSELESSTAPQRTSMPLATMQLQLR